jgi:hypothetical protein
MMMVSGFGPAQTAEIFLRPIRASAIEAVYPSGGGRLAVRASVAKGVTLELALRSRRDGWEGSRGRAPTALEQGREGSDC